MTAGLHEDEFAVSWTFEFHRLRSRDAGWRNAGRNAEGDPGHGLAEWASIPEKNASQEPIWAVTVVTSLAEGRRVTKHQVKLTASHPHPCYANWVCLSDLMSRAQLRRSRNSLLIGRDK